MMKNITKLFKHLRAIEDEVNRKYAAGRSENHYFCIENLGLCNDDHDDSLILRVEMRFGLYQENSQANYQYEETIFVEPDEFNAQYLLGYAAAVENYKEE